MNMKGTKGSSLLEGDGYLAKELTKLFNRIERILVPANSIVENTASSGLSALLSSVKKGSFFKDTHPGGFAEQTIRTVDWEMLEPLLLKAINHSPETLPLEIAEEIAIEKNIQTEKIDKVAKKCRILSLQSRNQQPIMPGKWRKEPFGRRKYEKLSEYKITSSIDPDEVVEMKKMLETTLNGFTGQSYSFNDHELTEDWMCAYRDSKTSGPSPDEIVKTQLESLVDIMVQQVQERVCTDMGVLDQDPVGLGPNLKEAPVWGIDCYTRRMIELAIEDRVDSSKCTKETVIHFIQRRLLPTINSVAPDIAHNMTHSLNKLIEELGTCPKTLFLAEYAKAVLEAVQELGLDSFRIHPKGTGVICTNPGGIPAHVFISEYLGEMYPAYRWCEKLDVVEQAQKTFDLKPTLPDFYNILLERPHQDPKGYGMMYVDASQSANMGSSCSHSCDPNCFSQVVARNGKLVIALTTTRAVHYGEELTMDYYSFTTSDVEWRAAVCLCGMNGCRGSFLHYATQEDLQQVLNQKYSPLCRYGALLRSCGPTPLTAIDQELLQRHGFLEAVMGKSIPLWLQKFTVENLRFVEFERTVLPIALLRDKHGIASAYRYSEADMDARSVMEQRIQAAASYISTVKQVLKKAVGGAQEEAPAPLTVLPASEVMPNIWERLLKIQALLDKHVLSPLRTAPQSKKKSSKSKSSAVDEAAALSLRKQQEERILKTIETVKELTAEMPVGLTQMRERSVQLRSALLAVQDLSTASARIGLLADMVVVWTHTQFFSQLKPYMATESEPIVVVARELGVTVPKSKIYGKIDASFRRGGAASAVAPVTVVPASTCPTTKEIDIMSIVAEKPESAEKKSPIGVDAVESLSNSVACPQKKPSSLSLSDSANELSAIDSEREENSMSAKKRKSKNSTTPPPGDNNKFDSALDPNEPVFMGSKKYPASFIFWQLMGWFNAGTDEHIGSPDLFGSVMLPELDECFGAAESLYGPKQRTLLFSHLFSSEKQTAPWPTAVKNCFSSGGLTDDSEETASKKFASLCGSPMLDASLGRPQSLRLLSSIFQPKTVEIPTSVAVKSAKKKNQQESIEQYDNRGVPEKECEWVQCDRADCHKWRRLPFHIDQSTLPDTWVCTDNTWDAEFASCEVPQEIYDPGEENLIDLETPGSNDEQIQVGEYRDVFCKVNRVYYEAKVVQIREPGAKTKYKRRQAKFHFKHWQSKFDEWIDIGDVRVKTHNLYTSPDCRDSVQQEEYQGVFIRGQNKKGYIKPADKGKKRAAPTLDGSSENGVGKKVSSVGSVKAQADVAARIAAEKAAKEKAERDEQRRQQRLKERSTEEGILERQLRLAQEKTEAMRKAKEEREKRKALVEYAEKRKKRKQEVSTDSWVQCALCTRWRRYPENVRIPEEVDWVCSMNTWDETAAFCDAPEESMNDHDDVYVHDVSIAPAHNVSVSPEALQASVSTEDLRDAEYFCQEEVIATASVPTALVPPISPECGALH